MVKPEVLVVDDEVEILNAISRVLRKDFSLHLFSDPEEALDYYQKKPTPLIISDMRMPGLSGAQLFAQIAKIYPHSKRILMTGFSDIAMAQEAVNEGKICHFIHKPWQNDELKQALVIALNNYQQEKKQRALTIRTKQQNAELKLLNHSLQLILNDQLTELNSLSDKESKTFERLKSTMSMLFTTLSYAIVLHVEDNTNRYKRIAAFSKHIADTLGCTPLISFQIYISGLLFDLGKLSIPQEILRKSSSELGQQEQTLLKNQFNDAQGFLKPYKELEYVVEIISQVPLYNRHSDNQSLCVGAQILALVKTYDELTVGYNDLVSVVSEQALKTLSTTIESDTSKNIISALSTLVKQHAQFESYPLEFTHHVQNLKEGMILTQDIVSHDGNIFLTTGSQLTTSNIDKLREIEKMQKEKFVVFVS